MERVNVTERLSRYVPLVLTVVVAGLGHLYLGYWKRGILWLGLYLFTLLVLGPYSPVLVGGEPEGPFVLHVLDGQLRAIDAVFPLTFLVLCVIDVYVHVVFMERPRAVD